MLLHKKTNIVYISSKAYTFIKTFINQSLVTVSNAQYNYITNVQDIKYTSSSNINCKQNMPLYSFI